MTNPLVSVIIPNFNYANYLEETINSALSQSYDNFEIIVIDDGSSDGSLELINKMITLDDRIRLYTHPNNENRGLGESLKLALSKARGNFIAFLEADDYWFQDSIKNRLEVIETTATDVVIGKLELISDDGSDISWFKSYISRVEGLNSERSAFGTKSFKLISKFLAENQIPTFSCVLAKKEVFNFIDFASPVPKWLDWWLWSQVALTYKFSFSPQPSTCWRIHSGSYNSKTQFSAYLTDGRKMWNGFRKQLYPKYRSMGNVSSCLFLKAPFWVRLGVRTIAIIKNEGVTSGLIRIKKRLFRS